ncbi:BgTH12-07270 [Blumeria graminis f. sp. triticale]|uniref:BgTH12-07270 n=1 Tax=Blumeria graminis f. sp. triticale TaxID=1689686 RepID=A0A9W4D981_BLUGR|nr:BgTH12-07270 [Blumeria graminis f. sp. triticale]
MKFYHSSFVSNLTILSLFLNIYGAFSDNIYECPSGDEISHSQIYSSDNMERFDKIRFTTIEEKVYQKTNLPRSDRYKVLNVYSNRRIETTYAVFNEEKQMVMLYQYRLVNYQEFIEECYYSRQG